MLRVGLAVVVVAVAVVLRAILLQVSRTNVNAICRAIARSTFVTKPHAK